MNDEPRKTTIEDDAPKPTTYGYCAPHKPCAHCVAVRKDPVPRCVCFHCIDGSRKR